MAFGSFLNELFCALMFSSEDIKTYIFKKIIKTEKIYLHLTSQRSHKQASKNIVKEKTNTPMKNGLEI